MPPASGASTTARRVAASSRLAAESAPLLAPSSDADSEGSKGHSQVSGGVSALLHTLLWCTAAAVITWYADLIPTVLYNKDLNRPVLYAGEVSLLCLVSAVCYMAFYLPWQRGEVIEDYQRVVPRVVYTTLALCFSTFLLLLAALWPVYRFFTPLILSVLAMAAILAPNLLPSAS